jgi:hypothetical protein
MHRNAQKTKKYIKKHNKTTKRNGGTTAINPSRTPWPTRFITQIKYTDEFDITLTSGALSSYVYNSNGLYDPDQTGTGHQPLGFDQYAAMYSRYRVLRTQYRVTFGNVATNGAAVRCRISHVNGSSIPVRPAIFETAVGKEIVVGPYGQPGVVQGSFDLTKLNADPRKYRIDDRFAATVTSNPAEVMYMILSLYPNVSSTCRVSVSFIYHVEFYDIETPGSSIGEGTTVEALRKKHKLDQAKQQQQ